ncbi:hypothetical protein [Brucella pseudogrignonensis]|uniref:Uncharacterized protein n=1 Tax=Brucella pseudogrignonensis TaxID=419475 RepID=A0ABU1MC03_9HYPH|nr:hypothetical protein [Brucella pseudogrignonensis]MDR6433176.1 hypothetical protein [Brucella pseudogrignonensis]
MGNTEDIKSGAHLKFEIITNNSAADGKTSNKAKVTVTQNDLALNNWGVQFSLTSGSATFTTNGLKTLDAKTVNGIASAEFTDNMIESGTITVVETTNDMNQPITDGSSDSKPYHFGPDGEMAYNLTINKIDDGAAADGIALDSASVIITDKNKNTPTSGTFIIKFTSSSNTTKFDVSKSNVDSRSTSNTLYVKATSNAAGDLEALAYFSDTVEEDTVTITASLLDDQSTNPQSAPFSFKNDRWQLIATPNTNYAEADGLSTNSIWLQLSLNGKQVPDDVNPIIQLELDNKDAFFDLTGALPDSTPSTYLIKAGHLSAGDYSTCSVYFKANNPCTVNVSVSVPSVKQIKPQSIPFRFISTSILKLEKVFDYQQGPLWDNSLNAIVTKADSSILYSKTLLRLYTKNNDRVFFVMTNENIDQERSKPNDIYIYTSQIEGIYTSVQVDFGSNKPGNVTICGEIVNAKNPESKDQKDFTFIYDGQIQ